MNNVIRSRNLVFVLVIALALVVTIAGCSTSQAPTYSAPAAAPSQANPAASPSPTASPAATPNPGTTPADNTQAATSTGMTAGDSTVSDVIGDTPTQPVDSGDPNALGSSDAPQADPTLG